MINFKNKFKNKLIKLGVKKDQTIILTIDLLKLILFLRSKKVKLDLKDIINPIKEIVSKNGNIVVYSFFWDFFKTNIFDYDNSKSASGSLSNFLLNDKEFKRTQNPVYSLLVWGKDKEKIYRMRHNDCFSKNSPFGYLINKKSKLLFVNIDFKKTGFPFFHLAEQEVGVYYRFFKIFSGKFIKNKKKRDISIKMYVRKKNYKILTYYSDHIEKILQKKKSLKKVKDFGSELSLIDLKTLYDLTIKQLKIEKKMFLHKETKI
jgi:aminoglycoside 3-N-acetyltransferase